MGSNIRSAQRPARPLALKSAWMRGFSPASCWPASCWPGPFPPAARSVRRGRYPSSGRRLGGSRGSGSPSQGEEGLQNQGRPPHQRQVQAGVVVEGLEARRPARRPDARHEKRSPRNVHPQRHQPIFRRGSDLDFEPRAGTQRLSPDSSGPIPDAARFGRPALGLPAGRRPAHLP